MFCSGFVLFFIFVRLSVWSTTYPIQYQACNALQTATAQFNVFNTQPVTVLTMLKRPHPISTRTAHPLSIFILLAGDIELNPGPSFNICNLNVRSLLNSLHKAAIFDLADSNHPDVFALSETWVRSTTTHSDLMDAIPTGYSLLSQPRDSDSATVGGGLAFLVHESLTNISSP